MYNESFSKEPNAEGFYDNFKKLYQKQRDIINNSVYKQGFKRHISIGINSVIFFYTSKEGV